MTPNIEAYHKFYEFMGALSVCMGCLAWWRKGSSDEDDLVSEAADTVLDALSDADTVSRVEAITGRDLRSQLTIEEAMELHRERTLRRFPNRN